MRHIIFVMIASICLMGTVFAQSPNQQNTTEQPAAAVPYTPPTPAQTQDIDQGLKDVHFAFDQYDLTDQDRQTLSGDADWLKAHPEVYVTIAGDADERGEIVYNLALSEKRADVTRDALVRMGVPGDHIVYATGWGKLYPVCEQSDESCWSENRRAHFEPWDAASLSASKTPNASQTASAASSAEGK
ncbi:MAG TPA: OmpA family protein [Terriglobales bacterium]|jgi:peptidoglycan-associated lipoprotein|nr:OmpA family protein [Terriglobales bacterium]